MRMGLLDGAGCFGKGLEIFFHSRQLWKYSLVPLLLTFVSYLLLAAGLLWGGGYLQEMVHNGVNTLPSWCAFLKYIYDVFHYLLLFLLTVAIFILTLPPLYEFYHGLFSDSLLERWGKEMGMEFVHRSFLENGRFLLQNMGFCLQTLLYTLLLFPFTFFIPVIGGALLWCFLAWRLGLSLIFPAAFLLGEDVKEVRLKLKGHFLFVFGFGLTASASLVIPLLFPLFLPGMTIGGALLYRKIRESEKKGTNIPPSIGDPEK